MNPDPNSVKLIFSYMFWIVLAIALVVWVLRGLGILTSIPGSVIWALILLGITMGVLSRVLAARRY